MPLVWFLPSEPASAGVLRQRLSVSLAFLPQDLLDDVLLASSELVNNAVAHGEGTVAITIWPSAALLRVEVTDSGRALPQLRQGPDDEDETGRGLLIVDALATRWGVTRTLHASGKTVWFEIGAAPQLDSS